MGARKKVLRLCFNVTTTSFAIQVALKMLEDLLVRNSIPFKIIQLEETFSFFYKLYNIYTVAIKYI